MSCDIEGYQRSASSFTSSLANLVSISSDLGFRVKVLPSPRLQSLSILTLATAARLLTKLPPTRSDTTTHSSYAIQIPGTNSFEIQHHKGRSGHERPSPVSFEEMIVQLPEEDQKANGHLAAREVSVEESKTGICFRE